MRKNEPKALKEQREANKRKAIINYHLNVIGNYNSSNYKNDDIKDSLTIIKDQLTQLFTAKIKNALPESIRNSKLEITREGIVVDNEKEIGYGDSEEGNTLRDYVNAFFDACDNLDDATQNGLTQELKEEINNNTIVVTSDNCIMIYDSLGGMWYAMPGPDCRDNNDIEK